MTRLVRHLLAAYDDADGDAQALAIVGCLFFLFCVAVTLLIIAFVVHRALGCAVSVVLVVKMFLFALKVPE